MSAPESTESTASQLAFCAQLAPEVAEITRAYYQPRAPHPYHSGALGGGVLIRESATRRREFFTEISTTGVTVGGFLTPERLAEHGLPEDIPPDAIIWSVITSHHSYPLQLNGVETPIDVGTSEHTHNYWDGKTWHTSRHVAPEDRAEGQPEWVTSALRPEELVGMRALVKQVRGLHQIAEVYQGDADRFVVDMDKLQCAPQMRKWLNISFAGALSMAREVRATGPYLRGFMNYHSTGYQRLPQNILERIPYYAEDDELVGPEFVGDVGKAVARMYRRSAFVARDSLRKRAWRARKAGQPYPLPASW